jgi:hypothetical protein
MKNRFQEEIVRIALAIVSLFIIVSAASAADDMKQPTLKVLKINNEFGMLVASMTVTNSNDFPIADVNFYCEISAPSGTVLKTLYNTLYQVIPATSSKSVTNFRVGFAPEQTRSAACAATTAKRVTSKK